MHLLPHLSQSCVKVTDPSEIELRPFNLIQQFLEQEVVVIIILNQ
jgi:hypothetical protein